MILTKDLVIFITGGASGLGEETVRQLHSAGCKVAAADRDLEKLQAMGLEGVLLIKCDVSKEEDVKAAIDETVAKFGTIHVAVTSAGVPWPMMTLTSKTSLDVKLFKKIMDVNVMGSIYVAKYASIVMAKNEPVNARGEKGVIIFVSSVAAEQGQRGQVGYSATKGAISGAVLPMARDLGKYGIRVVAIAPGVFETPIGVGTP